MMEPTEDRKRNDLSIRWPSGSWGKITAAGLNAVSVHPIYSRAYRLCWKALRPAALEDETQEKMWLSPTWELYERWVFARVTKLAEEVCSSNSGFSSRSAVRERTGKLPSGGEIRVLLQPKFPAFDQRKSGSRLLSGHKKPDLVLTLETGGIRRLLVIDAKYRTSRPNVLDTMASAHIYRDALRWYARTHSIGDNVRVLLSNYGALYLIQCCLDFDLGSVHKFFAVRPDMGIDLDSLATLMMRGSLLMVRESACMRRSQSI